MRSRVLACLFVIAAAIGALAFPAGSATSDPFRSKQWALDKIEVDEAWRRSDGSGVLVAVVDTGVDLGHPDLDGKVVSYTDADFVEPKGTCSGKGRVKSCVQDGANDENGHGTHVAGIIAAETENGQGVAGVARGAKILPVRVLDAEGSGTTDQVAAGIRYAADKGAKVINLSLGVVSGVGTLLKVLGELESVYSAVDYAVDKGSVVVIAAGNDGFPLCAEPAAHSKAVCVGATDKLDVRTFYSNNDATLSSTYLVAPGGDAITCSGSIFSAVLRGIGSTCATDGYDSYAGTSMAAPQVAGVAALLAGMGLRNTAIIDRLTRCTDDLGLAGRDAVFGFGRVNAFKAVTGC